MYSAKNDSGILETVATVVTQRSEANDARRPSASIEHSLNATVATRSYQSRLPTHDGGEATRVARGHGRTSWRRGGGRHTKSTRRGATPGSSDPLDMSASRNEVA